MSCNDLDQLRTASPGTGSAAWPLEARQHLASCEHCLQLQTALDLSEKADFSEGLQRRIEAAIIPNLRSVEPVASVLRVTVTLLLCATGVIVAANWRLGVAGWHARSALQAFVNLSLLGICILILANLLARQMMPGSSRNAPTVFYFAAPLLVLLAADLAMFGYRWSPKFAPEAISCWEIGVTCAGLSAPLFWLVLRRGFTLNPIAHGGITGLLAGLTGMTVLVIYCPYLDRLHISAGHVTAAITAALVGAALGGIRSRIGRRLA